MSLTKTDKAILKALNTLPEAQYEERMRKRMGNEDYEKFQKERLRFFQKKADRQIEVLTEKYYATKNRKYAQMAKMYGADVDL